MRCQSLDWNYSHVSILEMYSNLILAHMFHCIMNPLHLLQYTGKQKNGICSFVTLFQNEGSNKKFVKYSSQTAHMEKLQVAIGSKEDVDNYTSNIAHKFH